MGLTGLAPRGVPLDCEKGLFAKFKAEAENEIRGNAPGQLETLAEGEEGTSEGQLDFEEGGGSNGFDKSATGDATVRPPARLILCHAHAPFPPSSY